MTWLIEQIVTYPGSTHDLCCIAARHQGRPAVTTPRQTRQQTGMMTMNTPRLNADFNIGSMGEGYRKATEARFAADQQLGRRLGDALAKLVTYLRRGSVMAELNSMSDRELADVGLSRSNFTQVFDPQFAHEHARRGQ